MKFKRAVVSITLISVMLVILVGIGGCVSKTDYDSLMTQHNQLQSDKNQLESDYDKLVAENDALDKQHADLTQQHDTKVADYDSLSNTYEDLKKDSASMQQELDEIKKVYPLRGFSSVTELADWAVKHKQPYTEYMDDTFRSALKVQDAGLAEGYLISVMYDEDDTDPDFGWIWCGAMVNGHLYIWAPDEAEVYDWYASTFVR